MGVSILPSERTPWDVIGRDTGRALQQVLPGAVQQGYNRGQLLTSLDEISKIASNPNSTPLEISLAAMKAGAGIPGSEKYLGALIPQLVKFAEARRAQNVPLGGPESEQQRIREPLEAPPQSQRLPGFIGQENQNYPNNIGPQQAPGNLPQPATTGQALPLRTPAEKRKAAVDLSRISTAEGIPITPKEALEQIDKEEDDKKLHNAEVEKERQQRTISQEEYGNRGVAELKKIFPDSTPEMDAIFQKKGEQAGAQIKSEADINKYLAIEAKNFKNTITNVKRDMSAPRSLNRYQRKMLGTQKNFEQAANDLRVKLKPLLDLGLYDTARNLLTDLGYYPEERENIINPLSEHEKTLMNKVPKATKISRPEELGGPQVPSFFIPYEYNPNEKENIKSGLQDLMKANPNFDLVLARKAFEDKGYDWRIFKDSLNELESQGFKLTDDQETQRAYLDSPPLDTLGKILHGLGIVGR